MRVLITGITGFVGSHMADYLIKNVPNIHIDGGVVGMIMYNSYIKILMLLLLKVI